MSSNDPNTLRARLVDIALEWERRFGVAPRIVSAVSEYDAAMLVGCSEPDYADAMHGLTAVQKGFDFVFHGLRYQVKANRPSGKPGSRVTLVGKARNYEWDRLIWILYDSGFHIVEAWGWDVTAYRKAFDTVQRLNPDHLRAGRRLFPADAVVPPTHAPSNRLRAIHLIERLGNMRCVEEKSATWESGCWKVSAETAQQLVGGHIFLHKAQREPSFFGGTITGFRMEPGVGWEGLRAVFRFQAEPECTGVDSGRAGWGMEKKIVRG